MCNIKIHKIYLQASMGNTLLENLSSVKKTRFVMKFFCLEKKIFARLFFSEKKFSVEKNLSTKIK